MSIYLTDEQIDKIERKHGILSNPHFVATRAIANAASDHARRVTLDEETANTRRLAWLAKNPLRVEFLGVERRWLGSYPDGRTAFCDSPIAAIDYSMQQDAEAAAKDKPAPAPESPLDEATVRRCANMVREWAERRGFSANALLRDLESILPKPAPEQEPRYIMLAPDSANASSGLTPSDIAKRHGLLTAEEANDVAINHLNNPDNRNSGLLAALRAAANGGSK